MNNVQTDPKLLEALSAAAKRPITAEELRRQKVDYIVSSLSDDHTITADRVEQELQKLHGRAA
jgi:hypothetical protein